MGHRVGTQTTDHPPTERPETTVKARIATVFVASTSLLVWAVPAFAGTKLMG